MNHPHLMLQRRLRLLLTSVCLLAAAAAIVSLHGNRTMAFALLSSLLLVAVGLWIFTDRQLYRVLEWHDQTLRNANDQVERARLLESEFLANMSHELRTPLSTVIGISEMLQEEAEDQTESELVISMRRISISGRRLLKLLNELIDLASIEAGKMRLVAQNVYLADLVEDVMAEVQPLARENGNSMKSMVNSHIESIYTDSKRLRQILIHLMGNACRFTRDGLVSIDVSVDIGDDGNELVLFRITDTGSGIDAPLMTVIEQEFRQTGGINSLRKGGAGLRLSVCQRLAQLMNGHMDVLSTPAKGSIFMLYLPQSVITTDGDVWMQ